MTTLAPRPVQRYRWRDAEVPSVGHFEPSLRVSVVIPAKNCQTELDLTLAALAEQTYPTRLVEVVVVDDDSDVPLRVSDLAPTGTRILRLGAGSGSHGSGRARDAGARSTTGDVMLFLDADMIATKTHVEAHARWHHAVADAVVLGRKRFVDTDGITAVQVAGAVRADDMDGLLAGREQSSHRWVESMIKATDHLQEWREDTFLAVVGASVSISRDLYLESGGFASLGLRGIVDTEFGYRAFTAGAVVIPEQASLAYHQGARNFATRGDEIKRERVGLAANRLPIAMFRPANVGRRWAVPMLKVVVDATSATDADTLVTIDSVLASGLTDLMVCVSNAEANSGWLRDYFAHDVRVEFVDGPVATGFPSPFTALVPAATGVGRDSLGQLIALCRAREVGAVRVEPVQAGDRGAELWATRALHRSRRHHRDDLETGNGRLFGELWVSAESVGMRRVTPDVTRQGMIHEASAEDTSSPS